MIHSTRPVHARRKSLTLCVAGKIWRRKVLQIVIIIIEHVSRNVTL